MRLRSLPSRISLVLACIGLLPCFGYAQLEWEKRAIAVDALPESSSTILEFSFKNATGSTVTIKEVQPSCKCLVTKLEKKVYAPGEDGRIEAIINHEGRVGIHKESVIVVTDDTKNPYTELSITVKIADPVAISPAFVMWKVGANAEPKQIRLSFPLAGTEFIAAKCASEAFEVNETNADGVIVITISPKSTEKPVRVPIEISAKMNGKELRKYQAYAIVK